MFKIDSKLSLTLLLVLIAVFLYDLSYASITAENTSTYRGNGRWDWTVFIDADEETLDKINCVEYTLHSTFPDPVREVCNRDSKFALSTNGWGTFMLKIKVFYKNNTTEELEHELRFVEEAAASPVNIDTENWSREIKEGWWEWGVKLTGVSSELDRVRCVEYTLHKSFRNPIRTICDRAGNFEIKAKGWGTFSIPVKVLFKDGKVLKLNHELKLE